MRGILTRRLAARAAGGRGDAPGCSWPRPPPRASPPHRSRATGRSVRPTPSAPQPGEHLALVNWSGSNGRLRAWSTAWVASSSAMSTRDAATASKRRAASARQTATFAVLSANSMPPPSLYSGQHLHAGLNYVRMRDGISHRRHGAPPAGQDPGRRALPHRRSSTPGYATAAPHSLIDSLEGKAPSSDPLAPRHLHRRRSVIAPLLGIRHRQRADARHGVLGGCLRPLRAAVGLRRLRHDPDRRRPAVGPAPQGGHGRHLLLGDLAVRGGGHRPPDLAAITPLSSTDDLFSTGYPGGIYNTGFAGSWIAQRIVDAQAAPQGRATLGHGRDRHRGHDVPRQPGPAPRSPEARLVGGAQPEPGARRCSTNARRRCGPPTSRCPCSWWARSRTSRPVRSGRR